jgi:hypothetical protein
MQIAATPAQWIEAAALVEIVVVPSIHDANTGSGPQGDSRQGGNAIFRDCRPILP